MNFSTRLLQTKITFRMGGARVETAMSNNPGMVVTNCYEYRRYPNAI
jgi:hypothetical protein